MKRNLAFIYFFLFVLVANAQNPCPTFQFTTSSAQVQINSTSILLYEGQPLPLGSILIAIDDEGNCCSNPMVWNAQDTLIDILGQTTSLIGFRENEEIRFAVSLDGECFITAFKTFFQGHGNQGSDFFSNGEFYDLAFIEANAPFNILPPIVEYPDCNQEFGSIEVVIQGSGNFSYQWSHNAFVNSPKLFGLTSDLYTITVSENGCTDSISVDLIENSVPPPFEFLIDSTLTACDTLLVSNAMDCQECTYNWSNGHEEEALQIVSPGQYVVTVTQDECETLDTLDVSFSAAPSISIFTDDTQVCMGDTILLVGQGALSYQWLGSQPVLNPNSESTLAVINSNSVFYLVGTDFCNTDTSEIIQITTFPEPTAGEDDCIAKDNFEIQLNASGAIEYIWEENTIGPLSDLFIADPNASPTETTIYVVEMVDENGCNTTDSVTIEVIQDIISFVPLYNVITPNGDGKNDVLYFDGADKATERKLIIFDRRKKIVYQSENYNNDWNGTFKGSQLPSGTYYYILTINGQELRNKLTIIYE